MTTNEERKKILPAITLNLKNSSSRKPTAKAKPMIYKKIKCVSVEYEDGTIENWDNLPEDTAFFRERYTWEQEEDTRKVTHKLTVREINWVLKEKVTR